MKKILVILFLAAFFVSCKKNKRAELEISIQTELNGSSFDMSNTFSDSQNRSIRLELFKFYLSNLSFIDEGGELHEFEEIVLLDLGSSGFTSFTSAIPTGKYTGLSFGIGVPQNLNEQDPSNFSEEDHPLNTTQATFWGMNSMYRFVMIDGRYDLEPDQTFDGTFSYHTGHNASFRTVSFNQNFEFKKNETYQIELVIDISSILEGSSGNLDIINEANYHGNTDDQHISDMISDNFKSSISIKN